MALWLVQSQPKWVAAILKQMFFKPLHLYHFTLLHDDYNYVVILAEKIMEFLLDVTQTEPKCNS